MSKHENLYLRGRTWYFRFKMHGRKKPFAGSCFTHDLREAKRVLRDKMAEAESKPTVTTVATTRHMSIKALCAWDCQRARIRRSSDAVIDTTLRIYWKRLSENFEHAGEITAEALGFYAQRKLEQGLSAQTIKRDLWAARRGYEHAMLLDNALPPLAKLPQLNDDDPGKARGQDIPLEILEQWLKHLAPTSQAQAIVGLVTAIRSQELKRFTHEWIVKKSVQGETQHFLMLPRSATKGRKARSVALQPLTLKLLKRFAPFEANPRKAWATAALKVGLKKPISMRDLRTTFANKIAPHDADGVRLVMGHTSGDRNAAMYYQHASDERLVKLSRTTLKVFPFLRRMCQALLK